MARMLELHLASGYRILQPCLSLPYHLKNVRLLFLRSLDNDSPCKLTIFRKELDGLQLGLGPEGGQIGPHVLANPLSLFRAAGQTLRCHEVVFAAMNRKLEGTDGAYRG